MGVVHFFGIWLQLAYATGSLGVGPGMSNKLGLATGLLGCLSLLTHSRAEMSVVSL